MNRSHWFTWLSLRQAGTAGMKGGAEKPAEKAQDPIVSFSEEVETTEAPFPATPTAAQNTFNSAHVNSIQPIHRQADL